MEFLNYLSSCFPEMAQIWKIHKVVDISAFVCNALPLFMILLAIMNIKIYVAQCSEVNVFSVLWTYFFSHNKSERYQR